MAIYLYSHISLYGVMLNYAQEQLGIHRHNHTLLQSSSLMRLSTAQSCMQEHGSGFQTVVRKHL
jgi:hypothetical protein